MLLTRAIPLALAMLMLAACEMAQSAADQIHAHPATGADGCG